MALINKTGITDGGLIQAEHVTRIIDALSGVSADSIVATGSFSGSLTGNLTGTATLAGTATTASLVNVTSKPADIEGVYYVTLANSHNLAPEAERLYTLGNSLQFDTNDVTLTVGNGVGSVVGNLIGTAATASVATRASSSIITQQNANGTYPLVFTNNTVSNNPLYISPAGGGVLYNPQNNTLSNVGGLSGGTATFNTSLTVTGSLRVTGSVAHGIGIVAAGLNSHAEGFNTTASGNFSHAEGELCQVNGFSSHGEGRGSITWGAFSHAEGYETVGRGFASHTEGIRSVTGTAAAYSASLVSGSGAEPRIKVTLSGSYGNVTGLFSNAHTSSLYIRSTVPGSVKSVTIPISRSYYAAPNTIIESNANANEDFGATIIALHLTGSVLIGNAGIPAINWAGDQIISGDYAHAEGGTCNGIGYASHAEGESCASLGSNSHAEGAGTVACNTAAHSEGYLTRAFGVISHAEGQDTTALGNTSHAEGYQTQANGFASHAEGAGTIAYEDHQLVIGTWNFTGLSNQAFIIGNGTSTSARGNAFRVEKSGNVVADGTFTPGGADYAEYFESYNAQPIPVGTVVELTGSLIKICENAENAIGVISNKPSILGNSDEGTADEWVGKYEKDIWGNYIMESYEYELPAGISDQGTPLFKTEIGTRKKLSANYDETITYVPRSERPEWNVVGLLGQIKVLKNQQIPARWIKMKDINEDIAIYLVR